MIGSLCPTIVSNPPTQLSYCLSAPLTRGQKEGRCLMDALRVPKVTPPGSDLPVRKPPQLLLFESAIGASRKWPISSQARSAASARRRRRNSHALAESSHGV